MPQIPVIFLAFANDRVNDVAYLRNLPVELEGIRKNLNKAQQAGLCEVVERANVTIDNILDIFQDQRYRDRIAVFHYGGHANGYQLLLESATGAATTAQSDGLVPFLARQNSLQLVFLNGCSSQQQAQDLVDAGVPAVIGTSQAINDDIATGLSIRFYNSLSGGSSIGRAWDEAVDQVKIEKGTANYRSLYLEALESVVDAFPWNMFVKEGAEKILEWNLPEEVENPLFGLPDIPQAYDLPDEPFLFLRRYERRHAEVFFGRGYYIRELYDRLSNPRSAPLILLYGQSGVGKSSLLDAGVLPRMEESHVVRYLRRDRGRGLLGTLRNALQMDAPSENGQTELSYELQQKISELENISESADEALRQDITGLIRRLKQRRPSPIAIAESIAPETLSANSHEALSLLKQWKGIEQETGKPLIVILDQVEEVYTQANDMLPHELEDFLNEVSNLFFDPTRRPQGKLLLSYRKEYHPEIEEQLKTMTLPRERVFLQHLRRKDIVEVVNGLTSTEQLKARYGLEVQDTLPVIIADKLLSDKESSIAPVLQILLTKMWQLCRQDDYPYFSVDLYTQLDKEGILLDDFFHQQMEKIRAWDREVEQSGLALDVLNFHTSALGTANTRQGEEINKRYQHKQAPVQSLMQKFKELYLLADRPGDAAGLAHDTLAPLVQNEYRISDRTGQRAARILESKIIDFREDKNILLDKADLEMVEAGQQAMRTWSQEEEELIALSRKRRDRNAMIRRGVILAGIVLALAILGLSILADSNARQAKKQELLATEKAIEAAAQRDTANIQSQIAKVQTKAAEVEAIKAAIAELEAIEERNKAEQERLEALRQKRIAEEKTLEALRQEALARAASIAEAKAKRKAELDNLMAVLSGAEARFGQFLAKSKELAVQASNLREDPTLKSRLSLTSFQLNQEAYDGLRSSLGDFEENLERYARDSLYLTEHPQKVDSLTEMVGKLVGFAQEEQTPAEVFIALRDAYVTENSQPTRSSAGIRDKMADAESWALAMDDFGRVYFNNADGSLNSASLFTQNETSLPNIEQKGVLDNDGQPLKVRSMVSIGRTLFAGLTDGRVISWKAYENASINTLWPFPESEEAKGPYIGQGIMSLAFWREEARLLFVRGNTLYQVDLRTGEPLEPLLTASELSGTKVLSLIPQNGSTFVLAATSGKQGGILNRIYLEGEGAGSLESLDGLPETAGWHGMTYSAYSQYLVVSNAAGQLYLSTRIGQKNPKFHLIGKEHKGIVRSMAFDRSGKKLATAGMDGLITLRELSPNRAGIWTEQPTQLQFSSTNPKDNKPLKILSIAFNEPGDYLVFSDERELRICPTDPRAFNTRLCNINSQALKSADWAHYVDGIAQEDCLICQATTNSQQP